MVSNIKTDTQKSNLASGVETDTPLFIPIVNIGNNTSKFASIDDTEINIQKSNLASGVETDTPLFTLTINTETNKLVFIPITNKEESTQKINIENDTLVIPAMDDEINELISIPVVNTEADMQEAIPEMNDTETTNTLVYVSAINKKTKAIVFIPVLKTEIISQRFIPISNYKNNPKSNPALLEEKITEAITQLSHKIVRAREIRENKFKTIRDLVELGELSGNDKFWSKSTGEVNPTLKQEKFSNREVLREQREAKETQSLNIDI